MQRYQLSIIGTHLDLRIDSEMSLDPFFSSIESRLRAFERRYSRFIPDNWLDTLNTSRSGYLDSDGAIMLRAGLSASRLTGGYFDMTVASRLSELGYGRVRGGEKNLDSVSQAHGDYRDIEIQEGNRVILHGDIELEYGGVGKGHLIDLIRSMIEDQYEKNPPRYLINFGGDMYGYGGWRVGLENPLDLTEVIGTLTLDSSALACSAPTRRKWGGYHHLIDPHTGLPSRAVIAASIESESAMTADIHATTLCVMPWDLACQTIDETDGIEGVLVRYDGGVHQSSGSRAEVFR